VTWRRPRAVRIRGQDVTERRRFSRRQKNALYLGSGGRCAECGRPLDDRWPADHVIPWSRNGPTLISNGQALCPECNGRKGNRVTWSDEFKPRQFQTDLVQAVLARAAAGERFTLAGAFPGCGKTLAWQAVLTEAIREGQVEFGADYAPRVVLAQQAELDWHGHDDDGDIRLFDRRSRLQHVRHRPNKAPLLPPGLRHAALTSTYQSLISAPELHIEWAQDHAGRFMLFGDEYQFLGTDDEFGGGTKAARVFEQMSEYAWHTVGLSGYLARSDRKRLVLCDDLYQEISPGRWWPEPHVSSSYSDGIASEYLRPFDAAISDVHISWEPDAGRSIEYALSSGGEIPDKDRASLGAVLMNESVWQLLVDRVVQQLRIVKQINPTYAALIACMNVTEAKKVRSYLEQRYQGLRSLIAVAQDGPQAQRNLRDFKTGSYDVLVSVRQAFIGYDHKPITVVGVLTNYRDRGHLVQLIMRGGRVWDESESGHRNRDQRLHLVVTDDPPMQSFVEWLRTEVNDGLRRRQGGDGPRPGPREGGAVTAEVTTTRGATYDTDISAEDFARGQALLDETGPVLTPESMVRLIDRLRTGEPAQQRPPAKAAPMTEQEIVKEHKSKAAAAIGEYMRDRGVTPDRPDYGERRARLTRTLNAAFGIKSTDEITTAGKASDYVQHVIRWLPRAGV
jgi:superfamily II DNA or RNA helicase